PPSGRYDRLRWAHLKSFRLRSFWEWRQRAPAVESRFPSSFCSISCRGFPSSRLRIARLSHADQDGQWPVVGCETSQVPTRSFCDVALDPGRATAPRITAPHMWPSTKNTGSAPATFRISWLNPTPHTIAVYASPLPSPAAPQHSLAGGRYPLPAPDFHRLDRASFAWRTLFACYGRIIYRGRDAHF